MYGFFKTIANSIAKSRNRYFLLILHVIRDVVDIAQHIFYSQDGDQVLCTVSKFKAFSCRRAFENVGNRTKTDLVTLIQVNARDLSKIKTL